MDDVLPYLCFAGLALFVVLTLVWQTHRSTSILDEWAAENGFEILERENRILRRGPFFWTTSRNQTVYYVRVRDAHGAIRSGWVRCGGWFLGLMSSKAEARWD